MRSQGRANRRSRGGKGQDADQFSTFREEIHSETYSRSQQISHRDESLRLSPSPQRNSFEGTGDASSSRRSRDGDWRHSGSGHERYSYDVYHRNERDEYEIPASKDPDGWHGSDTHHSQSRSEWSQRHDHGNQTSSYPGASSWTSTPNSYQGGKSSYHGQWQSSETRNSAQGSRQQDTGPEDRYPVKDSSGWRGGRQEKGNRRFPRDSRWNSRRKDKLPDEGVRWEEPNERGPVEERAWEPAAAWKSSERENTPRRRGQNGQAQYQRNAKGGRRNLNANKQKRDWRSDDGSLNNWTRRDSHLYNNTKRSEIPNSFRKHPRSPSHSPSRSRSPAESYRSHRSSRARTRSPSISPPSKRRRRTSRNHSPAPRGRTPLEKDGSHWISNHRNDKDYSRSPSPYGSSDSFYARRRSSSSGSSVSTDRSVSKSPRDRPRAVHRLPTMNSDIPNTSRISRNIPARNTGFYRDDKIQVRNRRNDFGRRTDYNPKFASTEPTSMLPPSSIPSPRNIKKQPLIQDTVLEDTHSVVYTSNNTQRTRIVPSKATSKRLGKTSSSLKKFFPGDEDDLDLVAEEKQSVTSDIAYGAYPQPTTTSMPPPERTEFEPQDYNFTESHPSNQPRHGERRTLPGWRGEGELYYRDRASNGSQMKRPLFSPAVPKGLPHDNSPGSQGILSRLTELEDNRGDISPSATRNDETQSDLQDVTLFQPRSDAHEDTEAEIGSVDHGHSRGATAKELYTIISQVGEGTFGKVYKARNIITNVNVALKRIRMESEKDGFPVTAMREIKLLQSLRHENVVRLYEMMVSNGSVYMVFEYMDHDLTGVLSQTQFNFNQANLKSLCLQMLAGLAYLHHKGVIHRDIKGSNILINNRGELKLADFGLARFYQKRRRSDYTNRVITLWYRPPELLFGATIYGPEVDMWSAGCIMLELFTKKPVFQGNDEIHQLEVVYKIIGTPSPERWAGVMNLPWYELVKPREVIVNRFRELFQKWMSPAALDLAENLLAYDPTQRITASQAMLTPYFTQEDPPPAAPVGLATLEGEWHELETKRERARKRRRAEIVP